MANKRLDLGMISVVTTSSVDVGIRKYPVPIEAEDAVIRPIRRQGVTLGDYIVRRGWPVSPSKYTVRIDPLVSCKGEILQSRPAPEEIETEATVRWVADESYFNRTTGRWNPIQSSHYGLAWSSLPELQPTLVNTHYYSGKELLRHTGVQFNSSLRQTMHANLGSINSFGGYTIIAAAVIYPSYGNEAQRKQMGIWCPGGAPELEGEWLESDYGYELSILEGDLTLSTPTEEWASGMHILDNVGSGKIIYVGAAIGQPFSTIFFGNSTAQMKFQTIHTGDEMLTPREISLGRTSGTLEHCADMMMLDISLYAGSLDSATVTERISALSQAYGG